MFNSKASKMLRKVEFFLLKFSNYIILAFFICYVVGSLGLRRHFNVPEKYVEHFIPGLVAITVTLLVFRKHMKIRWLIANLYRVVIVFVLAYIAGVVEFAMLMTPDHFWIILIFCLVALVLTLSEFVINLEAVWKNEPLSHTETLLNFVKLYVISIFSFSFLYTILESMGDVHHFNISNPTILLFDFFYFSVVTVSTLGYGDITPMSLIAKLIVMAQTIIGYLFLSLLLGLMINWLGTEQEKTVEKTEEKLEEK
jgi:hypothetical protein